MKKLSFKKAAQKVLEKSHEPKSAKEITQIALEDGLIETQGATPEATMAAQLYVDINKNKKTVFQKVGRGLFALKKALAENKNSLQILEEQNLRIRTKLKNTLFEMDPFQFENLVGDLLQKIGFENVQVTKRSGDKGIDVIANLTVGGVTNVKTVVQAKRYKSTNKIPGNVIRELRGSAEVDQRGLVITTSSFQKDALNESKAPNKMPVSLIDGEKLLDLLIRYEVGVKKSDVTLLSIDTEYFENDPDSTSSFSRESSGKNKSIWPLPGGTNQFIVTLDKFLEEISRKPYSKQQFSKWIMSNFENVNSERTTSGYINVLKSIGVTRHEGGKIRLTANGSEYLDSKSYDLLYEIIGKNILAFIEVFELIQTSDDPINETILLAFINDNFDVEWTTFAQVNYRLMWLLNLGKIIKTDTGYITKA